MKDRPFFSTPSSAPPPARPSVVLVDLRDDLRVELRVEVRVELRDELRDDLLVMAFRWPARLKHRELASVAANFRDACASWYSLRIP
jgi:hypothetical protein